MNREELLLELRDISAPPEPAWWLLAPAYTILAAAALGVVLLAWWWWQRQRSRRLLRLATIELDRIGNGSGGGDAGQLARALARWLKQVALLAYPDHRLAGMHGDEWLAFLDRSLGQERFSRGEGRILADAVYRREADFDAAGLFGLCRDWLRAVEPRLRRRGRD